MNAPTFTRRSVLGCGVAMASYALAPTKAMAQAEPAGGLAGLTLAEAAGLLRSGDASPVDLVQACLERIERFNPSLNAFITVAQDQALARARQLEAEMQSGR